MKKLIICFIMLFLIVGCSSSSSSKKKKTTTKKKEEIKEVVQDVNTSLTLSFAGDCTFGNYAGQPEDGSFNQEYLNQGKNPGYFMNRVKDVFGNDDLSIVNLEGPLTTASNHLIKTFAFKGLPEYANILKQGNIEVVSNANNHSEDYYEQGLSDTKNILDQNGIGHFGYDDFYIKEVNGIKLGFLGYRSMSVSMNNEAGYQRIQGAINNLKTTQKCDMVIIFFHWGIEREYSANEDQRQLAHKCIDNGADLIIGSHPHVLQGTEVYNGKSIAYSLGNFCFGGNRNPSDTDSMIYQVKLDFTNKVLKSTTQNIIPCRLSSVSGRNNYQPMVLEGSEKQRVIEKINKYSFQ